MDDSALRGLTSGRRPDNTGRAPVMQTAPLSQLQMFLAVARHSSFSGAARELGVSTSAVSQAVKQLEEQLQVVLFTRTTRAVSPTDAGRRLVEEAGPAMKQAIAALAGAAAQPGEVVGRVKISVGATHVPFVIMPVLPEFHRRHPRIEVEVVVEERSRRSSITTRTTSSSAGAGIPAPIASPRRARRRSSVH